VRRRGPVAQWSELAAHNRLVGGSSPPGPTNKFNDLVIRSRRKDQIWQHPGSTRRFSRITSYVASTINNQNLLGVTVSRDLNSGNAVIGTYNG
jgi:hypothetical protein